MDVWKQYCFLAFAGLFICVTSQYSDVDNLHDVLSDSIQIDTGKPVVVVSSSPVPKQKSTSDKITPRVPQATTLEQTTMRAAATSKDTTVGSLTSIGKIRSTEGQSTITRRTSFAPSTQTPTHARSESSDTVPVSDSPGTTSTILFKSTELNTATLPKSTETNTATLPKSTTMITGRPTSITTDRSKTVTHMHTPSRQTTESLTKADTQTQTRKMITTIKNTPRVTSIQTTTLLTTPKITKAVTTVVTSPPKPTPDPRANQTVCYDGLGCFDNKSPFDNAVLDLPNSPEKVGTNIHLYTIRNPTFTEGQILDYANETTFEDTFFNPTKKTKVIIHGFSNTINSTWLHDMKDEFLKNDDFNVLIVAWGPGATFPDYAQAVANTRLVATQTHRTIKQLMKLGAKLEDMHLIGHSLGAHTCGYTGHLFSGKLGRITGLDPADPDFDTSPPLVILDPSDALFVDIVHSNGAPLTSGGAGMYQHSGHVDFYPNGGKSQPGCSLFSGHNLVDGLACSHGRSHELFIESINTRCPFTAYPCSNYEKFQAGECLECGYTGCSVLGYYSDQYYARGSMYMNTQSKSPFCGYHYGVTVTGSKTTQETKGKLYLRLKGNWGDSGFVPVSANAEKLKVGGVFSHVMVSPVEVGEVQTVFIKYEKYSGFWIGGGKDSYSVERVTVVSGENGDSYKFCLKNKELQHNTEVEAVKSSSKITC